MNSIDEAFDALDDAHSALSRAIGNIQRAGREERELDEELTRLLVRSLSDARSVVEDAADTLSEGLE